MAKKEIMSVSVSGSVREAVDEVAAARGVSRSALVERLLEAGVADERKSLKLLENPVYQAVGLAVAKLPGVMEFMSRMTGDGLTSDEIAEMRALIDDQIQRGRGRRRGGASSGGSSEGEGA